MIIIDGWIALHRKLLDSKVFSKPNLLKFWIWALLKASHAEREQMIGIQSIRLEKGEFIFGRKTAAQELNMTESSVYRNLIWFKNENMLSVKSNNKYTVVSVIKWEYYQDDIKVNEQLMNSKRTTNEQQMNTNNKVNNKDKRFLSSELPAAATDGEKVLTASENETTSGTMLDEIGSRQECREVLEQQIDVDENPDVKKTKKTNRKRRYEHNDPYYKAAKWLAGRIEARVPGYKKHSEATLQAWADSARLMIEVDKRDRNLLNALLSWSQTDEFWANNILSMPKFRKQFDNLNVRHHAAERGKPQAKTLPLDTGYINLADVVYGRQ